jgi:hypothetical protein
MRSADALGKALRGKLANIISEMGEFTLEEIELDEGLKSNIIGDPLFTVEVTSGESFTVSAAPRDICRSILRDYHFGCLRVESQWQNAMVLAEEKSIAWALVSAYYCSFFGSIEALRVCGTHLLTFSSEEAKQAFSGIGGPHLQRILGIKNFKGVVASDFSKIGYTKNGEKPHQAAWQQVDGVVLPMIAKTSPSWVDIAKFKNMCRGAGGWETPSDIRNRWNYRDPLYFGEIGANSGSPFVKLLTDDRAASSWIRAQASVKNECDSAASIASLTQLIRGAIQDTYQYGFLASKHLSK